MSTIKNLRAIIIRDQVTRETDLELQLKQQGVSSIRHIYGWNHFTAIPRDQADVVFVDYNTDILSALVILKKVCRDLPSAFVVMVCSPRNITVAVESLKHGSFDYILSGKDQYIYTGLVMKRIVKAIQVCDQKHQQSVTC